MVILKVLKTIKNNWKKSAFAVCALSYGASYANDKYKIQTLMREYCEEAEKHGDLIQYVTVPHKKVLVILNPAANKKSAEKNFEKYCEPILHVAGLYVDILKTDSEGHAVRYIEELETLPGAILVAGGDGTISEAVTGLLRRRKQENCPIGVIPVGRTNSVATKLYHMPLKANRFEEVRCLADSAISVVRGKTTKKDVMMIEVKPEEGQNTSKPIYAVGSLQWGAFRDAQSLRDKYWYTGPFREYASSLFNAFGNDLTWNCKATIQYTPPCSGCSNCYKKPEKETQISSGRWWSNLVPRFKLGHATQSSLPDYSKINNPNCDRRESLEINPSDVLLTTDTGSEDGVSSLRIRVGELFNSPYDFIVQSWSRIQTKELNAENEIEARTIELIPETISTDEKESFYSIDNEPYEVRPVKICLLPKAIDMYVL